MKNRILKTTVLMAMATLMTACSNQSAFISGGQDWQVTENSELGFHIEYPANLFAIADLTESNSQLPREFAQKTEGCEAFRENAFYSQEGELCLIHINPPNNSDSQILVHFKNIGKEASISIQEQILDSIKFSGPHELDFIETYFAQLALQDKQIEEIELLQIQEQDEKDGQYRVQAKYRSINDSSEIEERNYEIFVQVSYDNLQGFTIDEQGKNLITQSNYLNMEGLEDFLANQEKVVKSVRLHEEPDLEYREIFSDNSQEIYGLDYDGTGVLVRFTKSTAKNDILGEYKDFIRYKKLDSKHFMIESGQGTFPEKCMNGYKTKDIYAYISGELITSMEIQFVGTKNEWGYKSIVMPFRELGVYLDDDCFLEKPELASELPPDKYKGQLYVKTGNNYTIVDEDVSSSALILEDADLQKNLNQDEKFYFHLGGKEFILEED